MGITTQFTSSYSSSSGVDMIALFDDMQLMTLQGLAVSITREKVPIYVMGRARPVSVSRGKRGIAGNLQFILFDRDALYTVMNDKDHYYYAHSDEVNWIHNATNMANYQNELDATGDAPNRVAATGGDKAHTTAKSIKRAAEYMDQIYPFDITLISQNEYGLGSYSAIIGVEIINEGGGISMDDLTNETQATFIAIHRVPWTPIEKDTTATEYSASNIQLDDKGIFSYAVGTTDDDGKIYADKVDEAKVDPVKKDTPVKKD